ncbi:TIR domain-containing protein [Curtobacterium sp. RHCKG23]|uniref:TIR domain-containing protein n=1 Tax=Curtobacterium citri TaxID=3055139 RepID=A0ABT7TAE7_9MICO|nr:TIR domain-containing protein [Curtobacterium citri]MDM7886530.1 TIR domain-containing protein [Curtobacterium citri]
MSEYDFDVAVTFAAEDREFVDEVVRIVKTAGLTVFYDEDAKADIWGEELTEFFPDVYERRARYAVMFISTHYAAKPWTQLERRSVLLRAMQSPAPFLLPVRLDSTQLPGVRTSIAHLDAHAEGASGVANAIITKLGSSQADGGRRFNGRVPRTPSEVAILLGERPAGWEYLLFSYWLTTGLEGRYDAYNDHRLQFALGGEFIPTAALPEYIPTEFAKLASTTETFEQLLLGPAQHTAMGARGEEGDPVLIAHLASRMLLVFDELLSWSQRLRSATTPLEEGRLSLRAMADYASQPIEAVRSFVLDFRERMDGLSTTLQSGQSVELQLFIAFDVPEQVAQRYQSAFGQLNKAIT